MKNVWIKSGISSEKNIKTCLGTKSACGRLKTIQGQSLLRFECKNVSSDDIYLDGDSFICCVVLLYYAVWKHYIYHGIYTVLHYPRMSCTVLQHGAPVLCWTALLKVRFNEVDLAKSGVTL
jgi:hypothetical protein